MLFQVEDISFAYADQAVFRGLSLTIPLGGFMGIIGPNGCGKSTLLDLLCGLRSPAAGRVLLRGRDMAAMKRRPLARMIALVPQDYAINFPFSVEEVVMMGRYPRIPRFAAPGPFDRAMVTEVIRLTGLSDFRQRRITSLSGGERQRVVFARALAQDAEVLILDEATASMDIRHALDLLDLARTRARAKGRTILAVFQDLNLAAALCDQLMVMQQGKVKAMGPTREIFTAGMLREVFGVRAEVFEADFVQAPQVVVRPSGACG